MYDNLLLGRHDRFFQSQERCRHARCFPVTADAALATSKPSFSGRLLRYPAGRRVVTRRQSRRVLPARILAKVYSSPGGIDCHPILHRR